MKSIATFSSIEGAQKYQSVLIAAGIDARVDYSVPSAVDALAARVGSYNLSVASESVAEAKVLLGEYFTQSLSFRIDGIGEFIPSEQEALVMDYYRSEYPSLSHTDLLIALFFQSAISLALNDQRRRTKSSHVHASDILANARYAALDQFGADAPRWMTALGVSNSREIGKRLFRFIEMGGFSRQPDDSIKDFEVVSDYDDFMDPKPPNQLPEPTAPSGRGSS